MTPGSFSSSHLDKLAAVAKAIAALIF